MLDALEVLLGCKSLAAVLDGKMKSLASSVEHSWCTWLGLVWCAAVHIRHTHTQNLSSQELIPGKTGGLGNLVTFFFFPPQGLWKSEGIDSSNLEIREKKLNVSL